MLNAEAMLQNLLNSAYFKSNITSSMLLTHQLYINMVERNYFHYKLLIYHKACQVTNNEVLTFHAATLETYLIYSEAFKYALWNVLESILLS